MHTCIHIPMIGHWAGEGCTHGQAQAGKENDRQRNRQAERNTDIHTDKQKDRQTERRADIHTDRRTDRQKEGQQERDTQRTYIQRDR